MIEHLPDFLRAVVSTSMKILLMHSFIQPKYGKCITRLVMFGVVATDLLVASYCYLNVNLTILAKLNIILFTLLCFAIKPLFKDTFMQWLFIYITVQNVEVIVVVLSFIISRYLPMPVYSNIAVRLVLFSVAFYLLKFIMLRPIYRKIVRRWNVFFYVAVLIFINFAYYILTSNDIVKTFTEKTPQLLLLIALSVAAYISVFNSLKTLSKEYNLREENLKMQSRQELLKVSITAMEWRLHLQEQATQQVSIARHDHRHFSGVLLELLKEEQIQEAIHMLEQQLTIAPKTQFHFCENTVVNAAIAYYANICKQSGINIETKLDIPEQTGIDSVELSMAISNLLENALYACEKLPKGEIRKIQFKAVFTGQLLLEIKNHYIGKLNLDENGYPLSKEEGHGIGTKSVVAFVENQNGQLTYNLDNNVFRVRMMI
ncbi:sensor histidine kinase [Clostridium algidicarnis]|uniref:sensor histidine kinase n=1 Tax=Clostridium algidicarnis TaxID=37659 RepID=UPI001C0B4371|nr:sensor histidine kinase [Clostridium algidicarnis]MBU3194861.1 GHKL domain-containing protein [Clostridium algidicarnis]